MLTIIITCYNIPAYEKIAIDSVIKNTSVDYELILINNNGTKESKEQCLRYSKEHKLKYIEMKDNKCLGAAWNIAISQSEGEHIAFLSSDIIVSSGWDNKLLGAFKQVSKADLNVAAVGPSMPVARSAQKQEELFKRRMRVKPKDVAEIDEFYSLRFKDKQYEVNMLDENCFIISRRVIDFVGMFSEKFIINGSGADWMRRAYKQDLRLVWVKDCYVHHYGSLSLTQRENTDKDFSIEELNQKTDKIFSGGF